MRDRRVQLELAVAKYCDIILSVPISQNPYIENDKIKLIEAVLNLVQQCSLAL